MPSTVPALITPETLHDLQRYTMDLEVLLRFLADEQNLQSEAATTLIAKLASQYLTELHPLAESLEQVALEYAADLNLSA